jgi:hypothetical protein
VKDRQDANGVALAIVLPAMSSFFSLVSILFSFQLSAYLSILHQIIPPHRTLVQGPLEGASLRVQGQLTGLQGHPKQLKV